MSRFLAVFFLLFLGCNDTTVSEDPLDSDCGKGTKKVIQDGRTFCVYTWAIVIETGFNCPVNFDSFQGFEPVFGACTGFGALNEPEIIGVFEDFQTQPKYDLFVKNEPAPLDLLFVIDNSGSMCQEQDRLINAFERFIEPLADVDFHLGVTTTTMFDQYPPEPVALPAHLQSTPQPIPGFDATCIQDVGEDGGVIADSYEGLKKRLAFAATCMETPDPFYSNLTDADIACATGTTECSIGTRCGGANPDCTFANIAPPTDSYRNLPKVFRATDYRNGDSLDTDRLVADFRCAASVGTRGYGIEKGLEAAVTAVSRVKTGGLEGEPGADTTSANHGLIRKDSRFGLVFVTDENDCSHYDTIDESSSCGDAVCEYAIESGNLLVDIGEFKELLVMNLEESKGREIDPIQDIAIGSIHGRPTPLASPPLDVCSAGQPTGVVPACANENGVIFSGSRYAEFLNSFGESGFALSNSSAICQEDWSEYFISMGSFFRSRVN